MGVARHILALFHFFADEVAFVVEMVKRLSSALFHDVGTFDFDAYLVYRIRHAGDVCCGCPDRLDVEITPTGERFAYVHDSLDVQKVLDSFRPLGGWGGNDEQHLKREVGGLVLYLRMIAFDNPGGFQFVNPVPDSARGHAGFVADLLSRRIPGVQLEQVEDATVDVVEVGCHTFTHVGQPHVGWDARLEPVEPFRSRIHLTGGSNHTGGDEKMSIHETGYYWFQYCSEVDCPYQKAIIPLTPVLGRGPNTLQPVGGPDTGGFRSARRN